MSSLRQSIAKSWVPDLRVVQSDLALGLGLPQPLSLRDLTRLFDEPEVLTFQQPVDADALHGQVEVVLRSDGQYTFRGHMRATGFPSFSYQIQAIVRAPGVAIAMQAEGRVFGTDTPGERQRNWEETGNSPEIRKFWTALRSGARLDIVWDKDLSGITGGVVDVGAAAAEAVIAAYAAGVVGALVVLGANVGSAAGVTIRNPNILAGVTVAAGVYLAFGSSFVVAAVAAGSATTVLTDIRFRSLNDEEIRRAQEVFHGTLPIDRIVLTDLHSPDRGRAFVYPAIDGSIQVNLGASYDDPLGPDPRSPNSVYSVPGSLLMHELTHAWQIEHAPFLPAFICEALLNRDYHQDVTSQGNGKPWGDWEPEQQGSIVDSWYSTHYPALDSAAAVEDPRFRYISEHIRLGVY